MSISRPDPAEELWPAELDEDDGPEGYVEERDAHPEGGKPLPSLLPWLTTRRRMTRESALRLSLRCGARTMPWQVAAHRADRTHDGWAQKLARGGMGSGKSTWGGAETGAVVVLLPGGRHLVTAPTYDQVRQVCLPAYTAAVTRLQRHGYPVSLRGVRPTSMVDDLACGGQVFFRSYAKIGNLLGFEFASIWADELDTIPRASETLDILLTRLRQAFAADGHELPFRQLTVTTTPRGWTGAILAWHQSRMAAKTPAEKHAWYHCHATYRDNPFLPTGYGERLSRSMSVARYKRDVEALIDAPQDVVLSEYDPARHLRDWGAHGQRWDRGLPWWLAWDGGHSRAHIGVWQPGHGGAIICDEMADDCSQERQRAWILDLTNRIGAPPAAVALDRAMKSDRDWVRQALGVEPAWCHTHAEQNVDHGLERLRAGMDPVRGEPTLFVARHLAREPGQRGIHVCYQRYRYQLRPDGTPSTLPWKDNVHDHGVDMARYFVVKIWEGGAREVRVRRGGPAGGVTRTMIG